MLLCEPAASLDELYDSLNPSSPNSTTVNPSIGMNNRLPEPDDVLDELDDDMDDEDREEHLGIDETETNDAAADVDEAGDNGRADG